MSDERTPAAVPVDTDAPKVGEAWMFNSPGAAPVVIYAVLRDVAYYYDPSDPEDVSSSTFDAMARLARRVSHRVVLADQVEALRAERDELRQACEATREAFSFLPALNGAVDPANWTVEDVRAEVSAALAACMPPVSAALRQASEEVTP